MARVALILTDKPDGSINLRVRYVEPDLRPTDEDAKLTPAQMMAEYLAIHATRLSGGEGAEEEYEDG
jgi:hypothetical protein